MGPALRHPHQADAPQGRAGDPPPRGHRGPGQSGNNVVLEGNLYFVVLEEAQWEIENVYPGQN